MCIRDRLHTDAGAEEVIAGGVGLGAIGGEKAVLRVVVIKPNVGVAVPDAAEPFGGRRTQFGMGMRGWHKGQIFQAIRGFAAVDEVGAIGQGQGILKVQPGNRMDIEVKLTAVDPCCALHIGELAVLAVGVG